MLEEKFVLLLEAWQQAVGWWETASVVSWVTTIMTFVLSYTRRKKQKVNTVQLEEGLAERNGNVRDLTRSLELEKHRVKATALAFKIKDMSRECFSDMTSAELNRLSICQAELLVIRHELAPHKDLDVWIKDLTT